MQLSELTTKETMTIDMFGEDVEVDSTAVISDTLQRILTAKGIDSFALFIDGEEIRNTSQLKLDDQTPKTFADVDTVSVARSVKAGC